MLPKRILFAVHHYPPRRMGGAELLTRRLAHWLTAQDIAVEVVFVDSISRGNQTRVQAFCEQDGAVQLQRLELTLNANEDVALWYGSAALEQFFAKRIKEWQPDLLHIISGYLMGTAPLNAAQNSNIPNLVTLTDFWFLCPTIQLLRGDGNLCRGPEVTECLRCVYDEKKLARTMDKHAPGLVKSFWKTASTQTWLGKPLGVPERAGKLNARHNDLLNALNRTDAVVSLTQFVADLHIENGVDATKIRIKPDCLDPADFDRIDAPHADDGRVHFGYLGQITPIKGVDVLLKAFLELEKTSQTPVTLHIHGNLNASADYARHLEKLASGHTHIIFHGPYEHRRALNLMNQLDVLVVPSLWYENSPRVLLEAFAAGTPVIGTRVGGIAEVVQDNVNGLLFERGSVRDLAEKMRRMAQDPALGERLCQGIRPPRTPEQDMGEMMEIYAAVMEARR